MEGAIILWHEKMDISNPIPKWLLNSHHLESSLYFCDWVSLQQESGFDENPQWLSKSYFANWIGWKSSFPFIYNASYV